jgi:hypothetical protein
LRGVPPLPLRGISPNGGENTLSLRLITLISRFFSPFRGSARRAKGLKMGDKKIYFVTYVTIHLIVFLQFCRRKLNNMLDEKRYFKN